MIAEITDRAAIMSKISAEQPPRLHLALLIHLVNQFKDQILSHYLSGVGVTPAQFKVLIHIYKDITTPADICKYLQMDTGAMSRMVDRMVNCQLVERHPNPRDKRQLVLALTPKGRGLCEVFHDEALSTLLGELTGRLSAEEAQQLQALLLKMLPEEFTSLYV